MEKQFSVTGGVLKSNFLSVPKKSQFCAQLSSNYFPVDYECLVRVNGYVFEATNCRRYWQRCLREADALRSHITKGQYEQVETFDSVVGRAGFWRPAASGGLRPISAKLGAQSRSSGWRLQDDAGWTRQYLCCGRFRRQFPDDQVFSRWHSTLVAEIRRISARRRQRH